jgi:predicted DNA-binding helix-hairpin-helix protein
MLNLDMDPKLAWALANRARFPVDVNRADRETLLRVPGFGTRAVDKMIASRRTGPLRLGDIGRLSNGLKRARPFIVTPDWRPGMLDDARLKERLVAAPRQLALF